MGSSTAYHLAKKGVAATVIERCGIACAASGRAGGFLARDWCGSGPLGMLARASFDLHMELSKTFTDCDYRRVNTLSMEVNPGGKKLTTAPLPSWIDGGIESMSKLGSTDTTAQVHPYKLSNAFIKAASELTNTIVRIGVVEQVVITDGKVTGVKVGEGELIPADVVVITMGPWTGQARKWFPSLAPVYGDPAHSLVLRPKPNTTEITADALFTEFHGRGGITAPEIYPRPDGTVYVCGSGEKPKLPEDPQEIKSSEKTRDSLHKAASSICSHLADAEIVRYDCCFLPCPTGRLPMIGRIPGVEGAYVAAGHTCWGILNGPATGACLAELIVDGKCSLVDLSAFDPVNFK